MKTLGEFAHALSQGQKAQKVSAKDLAERTGLSPLAVRQILAGKSAPRLTNAMALAAELGLELVLVPQAVAQSLSAQPPAERTVQTNVERWVSGSFVHGVSDTISSKNAERFFGSGVATMLNPNKKK